MNKVIIFLICVALIPPFLWDNIHGAECLGAKKCCKRDGCRCLVLGIRCSQSRLRAAGGFLLRAYEGACLDGILAASVLPPLARSSARGIFWACPQRIVHGDLKLCMVA